MDSRDPRETLRQTPHLLELWDRSVRLSQEFPGYALIKRTPFLISDKGKVRTYDQRGYVLIPCEELRGASTLAIELHLIEYMIFCKFLRPKKVKELERCSRRITKRIHKIARSVTRQEYAHLQRQGSLMN